MKIWDNLLNSSKFISRFKTDCIKSGIANFSIFRMGLGSWEVWAIDFAVLSFILLFLVYNYFRKNYTYWEKQNIPYLKPKFPFGNMEDSFLMRKGIGEAWVNPHLILKISSWKIKLTHDIKNYRLICTSKAKVKNY